MAAHGNAENAKLNGEFAKHVTPLEKRHTSKIRRAKAKKNLTSLIRETEKVGLYEREEFSLQPTR
jgi:hypothetical protein